MHVIFGTETQTCWWQERLLPGSTLKTMTDKKLILELCQIWKSQFSWQMTAASGTVQRWQNSVTSGIWKYGF